MNTSRTEIEGLILKLKQLGAQFQVQDEQLKIKAPSGVIDPQSKALLKQHKKLIIELLQAKSSIPALDSQKGIWLLQQLNPQSTAYNISGCYQIQGVPNYAALEKSLEFLLSKHQLIRCFAQWIDNDLCFIEAPESVIPLIICTTRQTDLERLLQEQLHTVFDLETAPLVRIYINQLADKPELFYVHVVLHHLIADAWSCGLLAKDLAFSYWQFVGGLAVELPPLAYQFSDLVNEQEHYKLSEQFRGDRVYWQSRLEDCPEALNLPTDFMRPEKTGERGETITHTLSADEWTQIKNTTRQLGVSEFQFLSAIYLILLHQLSGQDDVVIGYPVSGREFSKQETVFGNLINMLPLRAQINSEQTLAEFIQAQQQLMLQDWQHQKIPFDKIIQSLPSRKSHSINPLFQHVFVMQNTPIRIDELEQGSIKLHSYPTEIAKFDLCLSAIPFTNGSLQLQLEFNCDLFHRHTAQSILDVFLYLIYGNPQLNVPIGQLKLQDNKAFASQFISNPRQSNYSGNKTVLDLLKLQVKNQPEAIAVVFAEQQLSYADLEKKSNDFAALLQQQGVRKGQLIGLAIERSLDLIPCLLAILKNGAAYLPLDLQSPADRLHLIINNAAPQFIITDSNLFDSDHQQQLIKLSVLQQEKTSKEFHPTPLESTDCAYVIYTSGSTGQPNGVVITHGNLVRLFHSTQDFFQFTKNDVWTLFHSYAFDYSVWEIWGALLYGGKLVIVPQEITQNSEAFVQLIKKEKVTILNQTPSAFNAIASGCADGNNQLRCIILAAEQLNPAALKEWFQKSNKIRIVNAYGITETTVFITLREMHAIDLAKRLRSPIGLPIEDLQVLVLDKNAHPVPQGFSGELYITGPGLASGYLNNPGLTAQRFVKLEDTGKFFYRSGDLVRVSANKELDYLGRIDKQIKIRGYRVELGEIEGALLTLKDVTDVAVLCEQDPLRGTLLRAYLVVTKNSKTLGEKEIRTKLQHLLPSYMIPQHFYFLDSIPLTINGKIDRPKLEALDEQTPQQAIPETNSYNKIEILLFTILESLLGKKITLDDNFFELGAHSLLLVQAHKLLKEQLNKELPLTVFFEYPNVKKLAEFLNSKTKTPSLKNKKSAEQASVHEPIAVIGIACRLPDANNKEEFWQNLYHGKESVRDIPLATPPTNSYKPDAPYIPRTAWVEDVDKFDAHFFGISSKEAELLDPQQRILLELAYHALEDAGYSNITQPQSIGVFTSSTLSRYLLFNLLNNQNIQASSHPLFMLLGNDKDFLANRIAYKLNFTGPALNIQTACSSSLVSIHQAVQSLRANECRMALAGGISINPKVEGYFYEEEGIGSKDGHCRPFDYLASGTVAGNGGALVVLKSLANALADNDRIYAVIKGSAINNDGAEKVGFVAPSIKGQTQVIQQAVDNAHLDKESIEYIETHGTATQLGDAIELAALNAVYGTGERPKYLGACKANIGHLDAAAGVVGFIKAVLALDQQCIPPQINFARMPEHLASLSPFTITTKALPWINTATTPRAAAVSSFGLGGTNAHIIVQEHIQKKQPSDSSYEYHLLLSAKTEEALLQNAQHLGLFLKNKSAPNLTDLAYTLATSRAHWPKRLIVTGRTQQELVDQLTQRHLSAGSTNNWEAIQNKIQAQGGSIISLPGYAFADTRYWITAPGTTQEKREPQLYLPVWEQMPCELVEEQQSMDIDVVFLSENSLMDVLLQAIKPHCIKVFPGKEFTQIAPNHYLINPEKREEYQKLWQSIKAMKPTIAKLLYTWSYFDELPSTQIIEQYCLFAPTYLIQTLVQEGSSKDKLNLQICRSYSAKIVGSDALKSEAALLDGVILTVPQELPSINIQALDLSPFLDNSDLQLVSHWLNSTLRFNTPDLSLLALRAGSFWKRNWQAYKPQRGLALIKMRSTVVITGGNSGIAQVLAPYLIKTYQCKIVYLSRNPAKKQQDSIQSIRCDVTKIEQVQEALTQIKEPVSAIIHLAGQAAKNIFLRKEPALIQQVLEPKVQGARNLAALMPVFNIPTLILFSSASALLGGIGELEYCAANQFLDTLALESDKPTHRILSINWGAWAQLGMRAQTQNHDEQEALSATEALHLLDQALCCPFPQIAALPYELSELRARYQKHLDDAFNKSPVHTIKASLNLAPRPKLSQSYRAPESDLEHQLALIWQNHLGVEQIGLDDNFFELGGDSLTALEMKAEQEKLLHITLNLEVLMRSQTISDLIKNCVSPPKQDDNILVPLTKTAKKLNLFCVHAVMGTVFSFIELAKGLDQHLNFFALQSPQLTDAQDVLTTIPDIAARYIVSLKKQQAQGPYFIAGWSFGALVAYEIARQLQTQNEEVAHLFIIDMAIQSATNPDFSLEEEQIKTRFLLDLKEVLNREVQEEEPEFQSLFHIFNSHVKATKDYFNHLEHYESLNCPSTIFSANEGMIKSSKNSDLGWAPHLIDYQVINFNADHYSILKAPTIDSVIEVVINKIPKEAQDER